MQVHREHAKHLLEQLGWVHRSKKRDIKTCGKMKHELCTYWNNEEEDSEGVPGKRWDSDKRETARHTLTVCAGAAHPPTARWHTWRLKHTHTLSGSCATKWSRWTGIPQWSLALTRNDEDSAACRRDTAPHLRSPSPSPSPWIDFLMRSSMVVSHWSRREMESNSFTWGREEKQKVVHGNTVKHRITPH